MLSLTSKDNRGQNEKKKRRNCFSFGSGLPKFVFINLQRSYNNNYNEKKKTQIKKALKMAA